MSRLGDVLELLFARPDPTVPIHAVIEERHDADTAERAAHGLVRKMKAEARRPPAAVKALMVPAMASALVMATGMEVSDRLRRRPRPVPRGSGPSRLELWLGPTGRVRMERTTPDPGGRATAPATATATIEDARSGSGGGLPAWPAPGDPTGRWPVPRAIDVERHFAHQALRRILGGVELRDAGEGEVAGRPVSVARGTPRGVEGLWPYWLPFGPEAYELSFDREYGDLLAYGAILDGETFDSATVTSITYGSPSA